MFCFNMELTVWPWAYSIWQIAGFELAHGFFSALCSLLVSLPAACWIWTTYRLRWASISNPAYWEYRMGFIKAVFCMVLLSLGAGLCAHVLEDIFIGWF